MYKDLYCVQRPLCHSLKPCCATFCGIVRKLTPELFGRVDVFETSWTVTNMIVVIFRYEDIQNLYYAFVKPFKNITRIPVNKAKKYYSYLPCRLQV